MASRRLPISSWLPVVLGLALSTPALWTSFFADDYLHRHWLEGGPSALPAYRGPLGLYDFGTEAEVALLKARGLIPWFTEDGFRTRFLRPLASLSLAFDHWAFGRRALPAHLHSLAWLALTIRLATVWLYRRARPEVAWWGALFFAASNWLALPSIWLAARNALMCLSFVLLALLAFDRDSERGRNGPWPAVFTSLGVLSGESGIVVLPMLIAACRVHRAPWHRIALPTLIVVAYTGAHLSLGYGVRGSAAYLGLDTPLLNLGGQLAVRWLTLALCALAFVPIPPVLYMLVGPAPFLVVGSVFAALLALAFALSSPAQRSAVVRNWPWIAAALLALAPGCFGFLGGRVLLGPGLVGCLWAATLFVPEQPRAGWTRLLAAAALLVPLGLSPFFRWTLSATIASSSAEYDRLFTEADPTCPTTHTAWVFGSDDPSLVMYGNVTAHFRHGRPVHHWIHPLATSHDITLTREGLHTVIATIDGPAFEGVFERLVRTSPPRPGTTQRVNDATVRVLSSEPWRVALTLPSIETTCLVVFDGRSLIHRPWPPPGTSINVPYHAGPQQR